MPATLCEVCHKNESKYKCPSCHKRTCSLACSRQHKTTDRCDGIKYDPLRYISNDNIKRADDCHHENNHLVQRDYHFLSGVKRQLDLQKNDGYQRNKRILYNGKGPSGDDAVGCHRVIRRGVNCLLLPRGMERSLVNKSRWDKKMDTFVWSIEWIICGPDEIFKHVSHKVKETTLLIDCMSNVVYERCCQMFGEGEENTTKEEMLKMGKIQFYIKQFPYNTTKMEDCKRLILLDSGYYHKCIGEIFRNRTVIEFPSIYIVKSVEDLPQGYIVVKEEESEEESVSSEVREDTEGELPEETRIDVSKDKEEEEEEDDYDPTSI